MEKLRYYLPPEAELLLYASFDALCYDDSWVRSGGDGSDTGIELPDDNWGAGNDEIELPDDKLN